MTNVKEFLFFSVSSDRLSIFLINSKQRDGIVLNLLFKTFPNSLSNDER